MADDSLSTPQILEVRRGSADLRRVGEVLAALRAARGISRSEVAVEAGVTEAYVGMVERGDRAPGVEVCRRLLKATGAAISTQLVHDERTTYLWVRDPEADDPLRLKFTLSAAALERETTRHLAKVRTRNARLGKGHVLLPWELPTDRPADGIQETFVVRGSSGEDARELAEDVQHRELVGEVVLRAAGFDADQLGLLLRAARFIELEPAWLRSALKRDPEGD